MQCLSVGGLRSAGGPGITSSSAHTVYTRTHKKYKCPSARHEAKSENGGTPPLIFEGA